MNNNDRKLELILAYLLGRPDAAPNDLQNELEQLAADLNMQALLERVETIFSPEDDPEWLEAIAAYSEGVTTPEVIELLNDRKVLEELDPDLVEQFDTLATAPLAQDLDILPKFPTFAEQFQAKQKKTPSAKPDQAEEVIWHRHQGFEWQYLKEKGQVIIRLLAEAFDSLANTLTQALQPSPDQLAYAGRRRSGQDEPLFQLELKDGLEGLAVTITATEEPSDPNRCNIVVKVNIPYRQQLELADTEVILKRRDLVLQTEVTDAFGKVVFKDVVRAELGQLSFEITPSP